jgi:hypothetical protein
MDWDDPDDLAILVGEEGDPNIADERCVVPMAAVGGAIRKIQHDLGHPGIFQTGPDLRDEIDHERKTEAVIEAMLAAEVAPNQYAA